MDFYVFLNNFRNVFKKRVDLTLFILPPLPFTIKNLSNQVMENFETCVTYHYLDRDSLCIVSSLIHSTSFLFMVGGMNNEELKFFFDCRCWIEIVTIYYYTYNFDI